MKIFCQSLVKVWRDNNAGFLRDTATPAKKQKGETEDIFKTLEKWFQEEKYSSIIIKTRPQNILHYLFCLICEKSIHTKYQGKTGLDRQCTSKKDLELLNGMTAHESVKQYFVSVDLDVNKLVSDQFHGRT